MSKRPRPLKREAPYFERFPQDTPKMVRRAHNIGDIYKNTIKCAVCGTTITSENRHDYKQCKCGAVAVDGGSWYMKRSGNMGACIELSKTYNDI